TDTASKRLGISGTRMRRMFEGRCVTTIVRIRPMRAASRDARRAEIPAKTFAQKKIAPSMTGSTPKRRKNQYAAKLCTTNPPANESRAKRLDSFRTTFRDRPIPKTLATLDEWAGSFETAFTSTNVERRVNSNASPNPKEAYRKTTAR